MKKSLIITLTAVMTAVIVVCSQITVPYTVPFTLQILGVFLALELLGGKMGTVSIALFALLGFAGLPVFSNFSSGFGPTSGFIIGFVLSALLFWACEKLIKKNIGLHIAFLVACLALCYLAGVVWFAIYTKRTDYIKMLYSLTIPFLPFDAIKIALAVLIGGRVRKALKINA